MVRRACMVQPRAAWDITGSFKSQIDWLPLESGGVRPTQGRTLAVCQVNAGSQSFNAVNALRILGRWMRMIVIPNQSSVAKAYEEFDGHTTAHRGEHRVKIILQSRGRSHTDA